MATFQIKALTVNEHAARRGINLKMETLLRISYVTGKTPRILTEQLQIHPFLAV
jgi:hypothetical protein